MEIITSMTVTNYNYKVRNQRILHTDKFLLNNYKLCKIRTLKLLCKLSHRQYTYYFYIIVLKFLFYIICDYYVKNFFFVCTEPDCNVT